MAEAGHSCVHHNANNERKPCFGLCRLMMVNDNNIHMIYNFTTEKLRTTKQAEMRVRFLNCTNGVIDIVWRDYFDDEVFIIQVAPRETVQIMCNSHHIWEARLLDGTRCLINGSLEYHCWNAPKIWEFENCAFVSLPEFSLKSLTCAALNGYLAKTSMILNLNVPMSLKEKLLVQRVPDDKRYIFKRPGAGIYVKDYSLCPEPPFVWMDNPAYPEPMVHIDYDRLEEYFTIKH